MTTDTKIQNKSGELKTPNPGLSVRSLDDLPDLKSSDGAEHLCILADVSGSMDGSYSGGKTRMQGLQEALSALWEITDWYACDTKAYRFSDWPESMPFDSSTTPQIGHTIGGTDFSQAMTKALEDSRLNRIILASDGCPNFYPETAVSECQNRGVTVDTIFIGVDEEDTGARLLKRISDETGGIFTLCKNAAELVHQFQQLETNNRLLLTHSGGELPGPDDVIKL